MQLSLTRRSASGVSLNAQYTLGNSKGNTGGSNEALTAGNNARALGRLRLRQRLQQLRRAPHLQPERALQRTRPRQQACSTRARRLGRRRHRQRAQRPAGATCSIARPDIVYVDGAGNVFTNPAADRTAVINTPGGGASRNVRRPDLVPGVDPFIKDGGLLFLNPAAFATPKPGTFGNLERNSIHGPSFRQVDLVVAKHLPVSRRTQCRVPDRGLQPLQRRQLREPGRHAAERAAGGNALDAKRTRSSPASPTRAAAAGTFGTLTSTVGTTVGLGTNRQIQFALRLNF